MKVSAEGHRVPSTRREAMNHVLWPELRQAEIAEWDKLMNKHKTFVEVSVKEQTKPALPLMHVYDFKLNTDSTIKRVKDRIVACGNRAKYGIDYNETFSATAQMRTFRCFMALAALHSLRVDAYDVTGAYLYGPMKETVFARYPPGFPGKPGHVLKVCNNIYGMPQAGRNWSEVLTTGFKGYGLVQLKSEPCVWIHPNTSLMIATHVDDILVASKSKEIN